jgi:hypothetical protein
MSQFAFLQAEFADIFDHASRRERLAHSDPRAAAFYCRSPGSTGTIARCILREVEPRSAA